MRSIGERGAVVGLSDGAGTLGTGSGFDLSPRRIPALLVGAALACVIALLLAVLPAPMAPSTQPPASPDRAHSQPLLGMSVGLAAAASATIGAAEHSFWPVRRGASLSSRGGGIASAFTASGARLRVVGGTLAVSLASVARGRHVERTTAVAPSAAANQIVYPHGPVSEVYRNGPYGLEQGFTVSKPPAAGGGALVLAMRVDGSLTPQRVGSQIVFRTHAGGTALRYGQLSALDATGRRLPARMELGGGGALRLLIDDSGARYPLRIDPFFQQGPKLSGTETGTKTQFGLNVALSADGATALIGGPGDKSEVGAAWVFTRSGTTWEQQGPKLVGGGESGKAHFGYAVALSSDGSTALIGGGGDNGELGAAWVFTRSGSTWEQQGAKLTGAGETGNGHFGFRAALSADGNTALIGGPADNTNVGAAWVFTRSGSTWEQQGAKLTGGEETGNGEFGEGVALSGDGNTALIGGGSDNAQVGAAWAFTRTESTWAQQGLKLTGTGEVGEGHFGFRVALSEDGTTALIGGGGDNGEVGAAWVFTRSESTWGQQGGKLTGGGESGKAHFGYSVAVSADGNAALIGGLADNSEAGAAWTFTRSGSTWAELGAKLTGLEESGKGLFGYGVALSGDGNTALVGGADDKNELGAAWVFVNIAAKSPTVVTGSVTSQTGSSATLNATVNPDGEMVTDCHFEYGTTTSYGTNVPCTSLPGAGGTPVAVSAPIGGLSHTIYHYRIVATNALGTGEGADRRFTTEEAPEYGRCVKVTPVKEGLKLVYHGGFTAATCLLKSETKTGKYEWLPGAAKAGFTTALKEGIVTFETVKKVKTTCKTETGSGEYSGAQEVGNVALKFTGCETGGQKCTTAGRTEGELETKKLEGKIGWELKEKKKVALDLFPIGRTGPFMEYTCTLGLPLTVQGSILVPVLADKMAVTSAVKYREVSGKQIPEHFEGEPKDVLTSTLNGIAFEQLAESASLTETAEEAIEINAVV
jgi:hypothetical protein